MKKLIIFLLPALLVLSACSNASSTAPSYDETKKMMTDAIQTEEGKKAIRQLLSEEEFRKHLVLEQPEVTAAIESTLLSKEGEDFWKETFDDPKFQKTIATSMKKQQQDIMKALMNDASFQKELEEFFGTPDMQKQLENILHSGSLKKEFQKAIEETISSPLLQAKWQELILKAGEVKPVEKKDDKKKKEEDKQESGGGQ
ncbi:spore germination lipoprotein GerD [Sporosarcina aquimarina]|uniref:Spore germination lipoprotein GerD n=1 Tax=Sporosarcina aquimarina TaxID=114975 RepID=A0ABU4FZ71_9BACL|nr:spore germination lipoprotein GerD [Sporosarcina aquimarina]MDW0110031.1 spore germination lipoprotein GerD [Sporosarcina aquimarina]